MIKDADVRVDLKSDGKPMASIILETGNVAGNPASVTECRSHEAIFVDGHACGILRAGIVAAHRRRKQKILQIWPPDSAAPEKCSGPDHQVPGAADLSFAGPFKAWMPDHDPGTGRRLHREAERIVG